MLRLSDQHRTASVMAANAALQTQARQEYDAPVQDQEHWHRQTALSGRAMQQQPQQQQQTSSAGSSGSLSSGCTSRRCRTCPQTDQHGRRCSRQVQQAACAAAAAAGQQQDSSCSRSEMLSEFWDGSKQQDVRSVMRYASGRSGH